MAFSTGKFLLYLLAFGAKPKIIDFKKIADTVIFFI